MRQYSENKSFNNPIHFNFIFIFLLKKESKSKKSIIMSLRII